MKFGTAGCNFGTAGCSLSTFGSSIKTQSVCGTAVYMLNWVGTAGNMLGTAEYKVMFDGTVGYMVSYGWMAQPDICMAQPDIW